LAGHEATDRSHRSSAQSPSVLPSPDANELPTAAINTSRNAGSCDTLTGTPDAGPPSSWSSSGRARATRRSRTGSWVHGLHAAFRALPNL